MNERVIKDISDFIFMSDIPEKSDIIFIPGTAKSVVIEKAAELYNSGYAKYILPSGLYSSRIKKFARENIDNLYYDGEYQTEFLYCKNILIKNGVPESAIVCEECATNTMENAKFSALVLKELGININSAILCCRSSHARRVFMSYSSYFPDIKIFVIPVDTNEITKENWFQNKDSYNKVMSEVCKCGKYFMKDNL